MFNTILEDSVPVIFETNVPVLFSVTVDGALMKKWKPWKLKYIELRSDGTMIYRKGKAPSSIQGKLDVKDIIISEVSMNLSTLNPLIEKEIGINVSCLKDNIKTYFRCIITESVFEQFHKSLISIGNVKFEKAADLRITEKHSKNQSTFRKAITKEWDRAHIRDRTLLVKARRGSFQSLPVLCENDLVHGSWWFVIGSIYIVIAAAVVLANNYNTSILGEDDDSTQHLTNFTFRASWILVILSGLLFTLGSLAFVRATHFDPPMKPLFTSYHVCTDELLASWLFFFGTLPAIPYIALFYQYANHLSSKIILILGLLMSFLFVYAILLFVFSCYPSSGDNQEGTRPQRVLNTTLILCKCFCSEKFLRKHLANDWLAGCWLFFWASIIATIGMLYLFFNALLSGNSTTQFIMGTGFSDSLMFAIGSAYFVSGSYPEITENTDMLTAPLTNMSRIEDDM